MCTVRIIQKTWRYCFDVVLQQEGQDKMIYFNFYSILYKNIFVTLYVLSLICQLTSNYLDR